MYISPVGQYGWINSFLPYSLNFAKNMVEATNLAVNASLVPVFLDITTFLIKTPTFRPNIISKKRFS